MKYQINFFVLVFALFFLFNSQAFAQEEEEEHIFTVGTYRTVMPDDGTSAERDSLLLEYHEAVTKKNDKIISSMELRHYWGNDSHDWVIITEYKNWEDIESAGKISDELFEKKWSEKKDRDEFNKLLGKYFEGHSDEIYRELPKFRK